MVSISIKLTLFLSFFLTYSCMNKSKSTPESLIKSFNQLTPWTSNLDWTSSAWKKYINTAIKVQEANQTDVEEAIKNFMEEAKKQPFIGYEIESKLFILLRIVFEIPQVASEKDRFSFKGWINWPKANEFGEINLGWPVKWINGQPNLESGYVGSEGKPYAALEEYQFLKMKYPFRKLK
jgi:hypothetical protein